MSALHTTKKAAPKTNPAEKKPRLTILPGVGLVELDDSLLTGILVERLAGKVGDELALFTMRMREGLLAASVAIGLEAMSEVMEAEVTELAGPKGKHDSAARAAYRHGREDGSVVLGGRKIPVRRPRVRAVTDTELHLESYDTFARLDLLTEHTVAAMLVGLFTRDYSAGLEAVGESVEAGARSKSSSAVS